jgi:hypothetical protein
MHIPFKLAVLTLSVTALASCGKKHADDKDKPGMGDKFENMLTGKPMHKALQAYNDGWEGTITLNDGASVPVSFEVLVPQSIEDDVRKNKEQIFKYAFGDVSLTQEGFKLPASGEISHHNVVRFEDSVHSALESREFVLLKFKFVGNKSEEGSEQFKQLTSEEEVKFRKMLTSLAPKFVGEETSKLSYIAVEMRMERMNSDTLEGVVVASKFGEAKTQVGSVQLKRTSAALKAVHKSPTTMETELYEFNASPSGGGMTFLASRK